MAGRQRPLEDFDTLLLRVQLGYTDKGGIVTGLAGVGKTVLLNAFENLALSRNLIVVKREASKQPAGFARKFPSLARRALLKMSPADRWKARARRAAGLLRGFKAQFDPEGKWTVTFDGADIEGVADTGDFVSDLPELVVALGEAAQEHGQLLVFLIDEIGVPRQPRTVRGGDVQTPGQPTGTADRVRRGRPAATALPDLRSADLRRADVRLARDRTPTRQRGTYCPRRARA